MNSLYSQLNPQANLNPPQNNIAGLVKAMKNSNNPMQMLQNVAKTNPQVQSVMNMINGSNKSPKDLFYDMAKQRGVDPQQIINMLNS